MCVSDSWSCGEPTQQHIQLAVNTFHNQQDFLPHNHTTPEREEAKCYRRGSTINQIRHNHQFHNKFYFNIHRPITVHLFFNHLRSDFLVGMMGIFRSCSSNNLFKMNEGAAVFNVSFFRIVLKSH